MADISAGQAKTLIAGFEMAAIQAESRIEAEPLVNYHARGFLKGRAEAFREASNKVMEALSAELQ